VAVPEPGAAPAPARAAGQPPPGGGVLRAAGAMGSATFLSRLLGLLREQVFAYLFGAGNLTDAFVVAFRIPNLLRDLFAEGAMSAALVPTFTRVRAEEGDARAWRVAGLVFRVLFLSMAALSALGILFAPQLVELYASALHAVPGKFELTVRMTRIMFPFFPLVALAAAYMAILNALGVFFLPAFASALFNAASIAVGVLCALAVFQARPELGFLPIEGMAIGVVAGGILQAFCQLPRLYRLGYRWQPRRRPDGASHPPWRRDPALRKMLWLMVPGTVGLAATQVNILVNTILATAQGPGAVSWLNYANRLMLFPIGIFGVSLAAATLPALSAQWVRREISAVPATLDRSLSTSFALNLPAAAGLAFLGPAIIELIFQYGRFNAEDTRFTALALAMYAVGLPAYSAVKILVPACYALGRTRVAVQSSVLAVALTIGFNLAALALLRGTEWERYGFMALALGTSLAAAANMGFLVHALRAVLRGAGGEWRLGPLARDLALQAAIALAMGVAVHFSAGALAQLLPEHWVHEELGRAWIVPLRLLRVGALVAEGALLVLLFSRILGVRGMSEALDIFVKKVKKKLLRAPT
jgi:putative peptidoglycan lipid II flippase